MKYLQIIFFFLFLINFSAFSQTKSDKPRKREGVLEFLKRNNCEGKENYAKFLELNKGKFGKDNGLLLDVEYKLPDIDSANTTEEKTKKKKTNNKVNKLFGDKYAEYEVKSTKLKGATFYLSSGHGGPDPGAQTNLDGNTLCEDEYAYDITLRLARRLLEEGASVYVIIQDTDNGIRDEAFLTCDKNETCMGGTIPLNQNARLAQRAKKINDLYKKKKSGYHRAVFIHLDSRSSQQQLDVFFYYTAGSNSGKKLAQTMSETFHQKYLEHQPNRGFSGTVSERGLFMLDKTTPIGLYCELGNIQNDFDRRRFIQTNNRQALANWLCMGFIEDFEKWGKAK